MKKYLLLFSSVCLLFSGYSQNKPAFKDAGLIGFDKAAAMKEANLKSDVPSIQKEYFEFLQRKFKASKKNNATVINASVPYSSNYNAVSKTININLNPANVNCTDFGFETMNFNSWTGDTWTLSGADWSITPTWSTGIVSMGTNTPTQPIAPGFASPTSNRQTIMTIPPTVNNPPTNCIGWDSIAINPSNHLSGIPFVPPTGSGVTCRLGNASTGAETERVRYNLAVSAANSQITLSYAVVLEKGSSHPPLAQPFFQINIYDQNGNPISSCGNYQVDAITAGTDPAFVTASTWNASGNTWADPGSPSFFDSIIYRPWAQIGIDLTPYLGTNVTIEFRTSDCAYGGHYGYAYVDANCSPAQIPVSMCPGSTSQEVIAPGGYASYQWYGPNTFTAIPAGSGGINDTLFISGGTVGNTYTVHCTGATGCVMNYTVALAQSNVNISSVSSTPSCISGNTGSASVTPTGSSSYNYAWTSSSGPIGGNTSTINNLAAGTYSVHVSEPGCGQKDTSVTVGVAPPYVLNQVKNYCGTKVYLTTPAGSSSIQWYNNAGTAISPQGNNDTLVVLNPVSGNVYSAVYTLSGCMDSLRIQLSPASGSGNFSHQILKNVCVGASNGQASITLNPSSAASTPYVYNISGPGAYSFNSNSSQTTFTFSNLAPGTYSVDVYDGVCFYNDQFRIDTLGIPVSVSVSPQILCFNDTSVINFSYNTASFASCQSVAAPCGSSSSYTVGLNNAANFTTSYPTPFGNWYTKMKAQYIYTAAELNGAGLSAGKINSIQFNVTSIDPTAATNYSNFNVGIGCTNQSTYSSSPVTADLIPGITNVYSNAIYSVTLGLNTFNFTQPYVWDGVSNIVIEVCFEMPGTSNFTYNCIVRNTTTTNYSSITVITDTDPICAGFSPTGFYNVQSAQMRPDANFGWCPVVVSPQQFNYSWNTTAGLFAPKQPPVILAQPSATTFYSVTITDTITGCSKVDTFSIFVTSGSAISVSPNVLHFSAAANSQAYNVCFSGNYNMSNALSWLTLSNASGFGSAAYTASVSNNFGPPRIDTIHITSGILKQKIIVIQDSLTSVAVQKFSGKKELSIYPNPSNGKFICHLQGYENHKLDIAVTDMMANILFTESFVCRGGDCNKNISLDNLAEGIYFIRIATETEVIIRKVMVDR